MRSVHHYPNEEHFSGTQICAAGFQLESATEMVRRRDETAAAFDRQSGIIPLS